MDKKIIERNHYNEKAGQLAASRNAHQEQSKSAADKALRQAHLYFEQEAIKIMQDKVSGTILDYGCGPGSRTLKFVNDKWRLTGIDISDKSLEIARLAAERNKIQVTYLNMDCEQTTFPDNIFDLILDYGTFSSLDMKKALPELIRILKPDGILIAIETLGHNPIYNLKRYLNVLQKKRTRWAAEHIMKIQDWNNFKIYFKDFEIKYFGFLTTSSILFIKFLPENVMSKILTILERMDDWLIKYGLLKKLAFKTVVITRTPIKL
jgi:ubiquinone/menaquinone biosynthesis C-methylase UbiE